MFFHSSKSSLNVGQLDQFSKRNEQLVVNEGGVIDKNNFTQVKSKEAFDKLGVRTSSVDNKLPVAIASIDEIGHFKGIVPRIVPEKTQREVVILDIGCACVKVVSTHSFYTTPFYRGVLETLRGPRFQLSVSNEYLATSEIIAMFMEQAARRSHQLSIPVINQDNRHIVVYDEIISKAVELRATDVHFEITNRDLSQVRLRIYGRLHSWRSFPTDLLRGCLASAFSKRTKSGTNSAGALSFERAMNTITEQEICGKTYNGRFSGYPLVNGYDVVIRLLESDHKSVMPSIESLGYSKSQISNQILPAIRKNSGMIAIAGSTGSGKSTALRSFIYNIPDRDSLKIYGVEDPVEYLNPFMRQISVQRNTDDADDVVKLKFLSALRSVLRMDPDVLMLGEIRDKDSAALASEFNRTGHRVFTTVHGDGCVDVLARLTSEEIGILPSTLASKKYLSAVMYQKLMPLLCSCCKIPAKLQLDSAKLNILETKFKLDLTNVYCANAEGCEKCRKEGIEAGGTFGLTVVAEVLVPTEEIRAHIARSDWLAVEQSWRKQRTTSFDSPDMNGKTAFEHALYKVSSGLIDPRDLEADFEPLSTYRIHV